MNSLTGPLLVKAEEVVGKEQITYHSIEVKIRDLLLTNTQ